MIKKLTLTLVAFLAVVIGFLTIAPSEMSFDDAGYNSKNVLEHLQVIADKPHSVTDYEAHEEVRQYILNVSKGFVGEENVRERNYLTPSNKNPTDGIEYVGADLVEANEIDCEYDIRNVLACLNGKSETGVLLVAHYDSRGNIKRYGELAKSYGAGDDGYGVATLLELMRYFSERKDALENSVYFLFTDSEEPNMYGSLLESKNTELMNKVNLVINVEARGMNGAVYMFETSLKNNKVIKLFRKAESPVTYSVAPAVYSVMTNYTDFTNFLAAGKNGLNFSTLNDINDYHVPSDCYANVNTATVQHYGEQLLPIVEEYVSDTVYSDMNYFDGTHDAVFFNFLPEVFVSYSSVTAVVLAVCVLLALTALIVVGALNLTPEYRGTFKDVVQSAWYAPYVDTAAAYGIVNGVGDGKFNPDGAITVEGGTHTARVSRVIRDLNGTAVVLRAAEAPDAPPLRVVLPEGVRVAEGDTLSFSLLADRCRLWEE